MRTLELLAPAKNLECGIAAIDSGADAVYIGAKHFGARAAAGNSIDDICQLCDYAHKFGAKVHVTVNTIIYDNELEETMQLVRQLAEIGVDALLVQDMGLLSLIRKEGLNIELHASTQCDTRTAEKVLWLEEQGFDRAVLARELSAQEISDIHRKVPDMDLEVFVHGALCVSYSGVCYASQHCFGRSANRGECAQFCRLKFDLIDSDGKMVERQRYLLSLKDMCQINNLEALADAGACAFKIEGRLKDVGYVKNVVSAYNQQLEKIVKEHPDKYRRESLGKVNYLFTPNLKKTFNRGYTTYFLNGRQPDIFSPNTPKALGEFVGHVKEIRRDSFNVAGTASFANGDGLCYINDEHELEGFRVNRAVGNRLYPYKMPKNIRQGMALYRNNDQEFEKILGGKTSERKIPVDIVFGLTDSGFSIEIKFSANAGGIDNPDKVCSQDSIEFQHQTAKRPQRDNIIKQLSKLGNTIFEAENIEIADGADSFFIPNSLLSDIRRKGIENFEKILSQMLEECRQGKVKDNSLGGNTERKDFVWQPEYSSFGYLYNISNNAAIRFYEDKEKKDIQPAFEIKEPHKALIMQCRHCIRYSLGFCVRRGGQRPEWHEPLYLRLPDSRKFRLEFKCDECQMNIYTE